MIKLHYKLFLSVSFTKKADVRPSVHITGLQFEPAIYFRNAAIAMNVLLAVENVAALQL